MPIHSWSPAVTMQDGIGVDAPPALAPSARFAQFCRAIPGIFLLLALSVLLLSHPSRTLGDPDSLWHVAVGRWIWEHRQVPYTDSFSHTFEGAPWIAKEWLSQLIFYRVHEVAGWWGVVALTVTSIGLAFVVLQEWLLRRLHPLVAILATLLAIVLYSVHFLARPHILVLPILVVWMITLVSAADRRRAPPLALALLMVAWVNMHGSFPLGLVMAGLLACEGVLLQPSGTRARAFRGWASFLALACAATLVSPYGWQAILVPLKIGNAETLRYIDEWQPLTLDILGSLALAILVGVPILLARNIRAEAFRLLAVALVGYMMIRHVRFVSLFGIVSAVLVARVLASHWGFGLKTRWQPPSFLIGLIVPPAFVVLFFAVTMRPAPAPNVAPDAAFHFAMAHGAAGLVYNDYNFGGYLIAAGTKTFIDGRTDQLFLGDFVPKLQSALKDHKDDAFAAILARYHVGWALVATGSRDAAHLSRLPRWSKLYEDKVATAFVVR